VPTYADYRTTDYSMTDNVVHYLLTEQMHYKPLTYQDEQELGGILELDRFLTETEKKISRQDLSMWIARVYCILKPIMNRIVVRFCPNILDYPDIEIIGSSSFRKLIDGPLSEPLIAMVSKYLKIDNSRTEIILRFLSCITRLEPYSYDENRFEKVHREGQKARNKLILSNLRLVVSIAKKYQRQGLDFEDLIQEGRIGLMRTIDKFDHRKGWKFSTYSSWWIRQSISRALANYSRDIRLPSHILEMERSIAKTKAKLIKVTGKLPSDKDIADELGTTEEKVSSIREIFNRESISIYSPVGEDGTCLEDLIPDGTIQDPGDLVIDNELSDECKEVLSKALTDRERKIIEYRFIKSLTLEQTGEIIGVTRERIRQIQETALRKLRADRDMLKIKRYLEEY